MILTGPPPGGGGQRQGGAQRGLVGGQRLVQQLDLTAEQQKTWAPIEADLRAKMAAAFSSAGGDREAIRLQVRQNMDEALARLQPILTAEQKQKLAALRATMAQGRADRAGFTAGVVYVLRDSKPTPVAVRVGVTDGAFTEIRGPLKPGDQVITGGGPKPKAQPRSPFGGGPGGAGASPRVRM
jgi:HlyD family secretion protein